MAKLTSNILVVLTLLASGHCFVSSLIDGPLKAAYSIFGNQGARAAVAPPASYRSTPAQSAMENQQFNAASNIAVNPGSYYSNDYPIINLNDKPVIGSNYQVNDRPNGWQKTLVVSVEPLTMDGWNSGHSDIPASDGSSNRQNIFEMSETDLSRNTQQKKFGNRNRGWNSVYNAIGSSNRNQNIDSNNRPTVDSLQDWVVDFDDAIQGISVSPTSDIVIVAQPAISKSSRGIFIRQ